MNFLHMRQSIRPLPTSTKLGSVLTALILASTMGLPTAWAQAPSQKPLLSRDGGSVKPNVVLTLDDSTSMAYQYSPEGQITVGGGSVIMADGSGFINHPDDNRYASGFVKGTVLADPSDTSNIFQRQQRSPDVNTIYYTPEKRYLPWVNADGTRMANANVNSVKLDPVGYTTNSTVDLDVATTSRKSSASGFGWCTAISSPTSVTCTNTNTNKNFQPALYFRLRKNGDGSYKSAATASNFDMFNLGNTAVTTYTKYPDRTDCSLAACTRAEELQNFANWFMYYRSRLLLAQAAIPEAFSGIQNKLRLGWGDIHKDYSNIDGVSTAAVSQGVRDLTTAHKSTFFNWIRTKDLVGGTPLREAMYAVGMYYSRSDNGGPWSDDPQTSSTADHKSCRKAYHILVTDGDWNTSNAPLTLPNLGNNDNSSGSTITGPGGRTYAYEPVAPYKDSYSNQLADVAMRFWKNDLRPTGSGNLDNKVQPTADNPAFWQHMVNYTVALGLTGTLDPASDLPSLVAGTKTWSSDKIDDLWHAAVNSRGEFFNAKDSSELATAIRTSLNQAAERELLEAGVATASTVLESNNRKYIPSYKTAVWSGDVGSYNLDSQGQAGAKTWSALSKLPAWGSRRIVAWDPALSTPAAVTFTHGNLTPLSRAAISLTDASNIIDFIRGDRSNEGATGFRQRDSVLGDFINTTPVFAKDSFDAGYATLPSIGGAYGLYVNGVKKVRDGVLYVGANDGMLHAFKETKGVAPSEDGKEIFAYVPGAVMGSLSNLVSRTYGTTDNYHTYFVDGPMREADVYVPPPGGGGATWRNYLFGSTGAGARAVYALDITDPNALSKSSVRWEISSATQPDLGHVMFPITSGVLPNGRWVAIFGNGYGSTAGLAKLFVVDVATGSVERLSAGAQTGNGLGGATILRDAQGYISALYAGDLKGKLWKFEVDGTAASGFRVANSGAALFTATDTGGVGQPIFQPPVLFEHSLGGKIVVFGTGRLITDADADTTTMQTMYGVRDLPPESIALPMGRGNLATRTISVFNGTGGSSGQVFFDFTGPAVNWTSQRGWVIDLAVAGYTGLRVAYPPQAADDRFVLISAVSPAQNLVACEEATGKGANFIFPVETGLAADDAIFDTNGDGAINASDRKGAGYAANADGVDAVLTGATPGELSIQNTTGQMRVLLPPRAVTPAGTVLRDRVWRRIINPPIR